MKRVVLGLLAVAAAALVMLGCGEGNSDSGGATTKNSKATEKVEPVSATPGCKDVRAPKPPPFAGLNPPKRTTERGDRMVARVKTTCGTFEIALNTLWSPRTVNSFASLARRGMYEDLSFDRIAPGKMIQGGDPKGSGTNSSGPGYSVVEKPPANFAYTKWVVAMSQRPPPAEPPGSSRSQFFIVLADNLDLPPIYAPIGRVKEGFDVVERIGRLGSRSEKPRKPVLIEWIWAKKGV